MTTTQRNVLWSIVYGLGGGLLAVALLTGLQMAFAIRSPSPGVRAGFFAAGMIGVWPFMRRLRAEDGHPMYGFWRWVTFVVACGGIFAVVGYLAR